MEPFQQTKRETAAADWVVAIRLLVVPSRWVWLQFALMLGDMLRQVQVTPSHPIAPSMTLTSRFCLFPRHWHASIGC